MNSKLLLVFILIFLVLLFLFQYLKQDSNIIVLLSVIIILCVNKLIMQKEYFN